MPVTVNLTRKPNGKSVDFAGKELEFLIQEIVREVNTSGSKSQDMEIIQLTLQMKNEVERIREQVQNVE